MPQLLKGDSLKPTVMRKYCNKWKVSTVAGLITIITILYLYNDSDTTRLWHCSLRCSLSRTFQLEQSRQSYPKNSIAIAVLVPWDRPSDVYMVVNTMLKSIEKHQQMTILMFSDSDIPWHLNRTIAAKTSRHNIKYIKTYFSYPKGFNDNISSPFVKRSKWGYNHMCRFWFRNIWLHQEIQSFKYILRLDCDSCLFRNSLSLQTGSSLVYMHHIFAWEYKFIEGLKKTITNYVQKNAIQPKHPDLYRIFMTNMKRLPTWYNNVELTSVKFMNTPEVRHFTEYIDATYGQYKYRWGDAPLRFATMALFAPPKSVKPLSLGDCYCHPCF